MNEEERLRSLIREALLWEAARGPDDLPEGISVTIEDIGNGDYSVYYSDPDGMQSETMIGIIEITDDPVFADGDCGGAYEVMRSKAPKGWGPLLYDVAMEWASVKGGGLIADRDEVSPAAQRVWSYYKESRSDVQAIPLKSDCEHTREGSIHEKTPLDYRYVKSPTTIQALRKLGRIHLP